MEKDIDKTSIVKKPKSVKNYINGADFYKALVDYNKKILEAKADDYPKPQMSRYIGECICKISEKLSTKFNFISYSFRDEMISDATEKMIESVEKYDINYSSNVSPNPLGYFTQIAWNSFLQRIEKEKKQQYIKHKNFEKTFFHEMEQEIVDMFNNEEHNQVIENFENPKPKTNITPHRNLDYSKNKKSKKITSPEEVKKN